MTKPRPNRFKRSRGGSTYAVLGILAAVLLAVAGYFLFAPRAKELKNPQPSPSVVFHSPLPAKPDTTHEWYSSAHEAPLHHKNVHSPEKPGSLSDRKQHQTGIGKLAVIIDDMGSSMQEAHALAHIGVPLTFSIIPGLRSYQEVASYAAKGGLVETMIHIPMQPKGWPQRRLEGNGLLVSMTDTEIKERLEAFMRDIPQAVGANNHMGSEFTEHNDKMQPVLEVLKNKGLFFIDSATSSRSVGLQLSRGMGERSARRSVFLDNEQNVQYITSQLNQAVRLAKKNGEAIAICHPHTATIKALAAVLPGLEGQGITLVRASQLVK
ncbi:divergent polysaccharide deacetylase family protein [Pelotalea chapellei]|uniref:Divergent polysaccharide deacetylase family protein n=1 Tax=Pelotalea chapellei TaxID=44671 RepID=A0ABS5U711_9BACT|nr:divergent polysaccharide deacetylase family protein [Pelotalea chapellei]MBT1071446.1 divergent polysaccharide deacetylase family protein [Pelotalea chapellei]